MARGPAGFTLLELLVSMFLASVLVAGLVQLMGSHNHRQIQQELSVATEQNVRIGMDLVADTLRAGGDGVPKTNLSAWIPWVIGFGANPRVVGGPPDAISIARCSPQPVATLSVRAAKGATSLTVASAVPGLTISAQLDADKKRLIFVGDLENAHVTGIAGDVVSIDSDPTTAGAQGLEHAYPAGAPLCRVDVLTFGIRSNPTTGAPELYVDANQGLGARGIALGASDLRVTTVTAGRRYVIALTARATRLDPVTKTHLARSLRSDVLVRNGV